MKDKVDLQGLITLDHKQPWLLLYFNTSWCAPCKDMAQIMEDASIQYFDQLSLVKIDVDNNIELARNCGVKGVPTLVLLDKLSNKSSLVGGVTKTQLSNWLNSQFV